MFERLLFKLHITNNLTIERDRSGRALVTIHRTDDISSNIRPDLQKLKNYQANMKIDAVRYGLPINKDSDV